VELHGLVWRASGNKKVYFFNEGNDDGGRAVIIMPLCPSMNNKSTSMMLPKMFLISACFSAIVCRVFHYVFDLDVGYDEA